MRKYLITTFLILGAIIIIGAGCTQTGKEEAMMNDGVKDDEAMMAPDAMMEDDEVMKSDDAMMEDDEVMKSDDAMMEDKQSYAGAVLAGSSSKLYDFNQADYEKALKTGNLVALYFYATWCPVCQAETADALYPAFNELNNTNIIGFRVNYNDNDTDSYEKDLARQFGVAYQHTKVFVKNGERVLKSPESWDKERYLEELSKAL